MSEPLALADAMLNRHRCSSSDRQSWIIYCSAGASRPRPSLCQNTVQAKLGDAARSPAFLRFSRVLFPRSRAIAEGGWFCFVNTILIHWRTSSLIRRLCAQCSDCEHYLGKYGYYSSVLKRYQQSASDPSQRRSVAVLARSL